MTPVLWGLLGAVTFGTGDFLARSVGRGIGPTATTLGMLIAGMVTFWLWIWIDGLPVVLDGGGFALIVPAGLVIMAATLLFFAALTRGPVSIVAPIGAGFPVWVVVIGLFLGIVPLIEQFVAMGLVMIGALIVTRFSDPQGDDIQGTGGIAPTVLMTIAVTMMFAGVLYVAREASLIFGEVQATAWMRIVSLLAMVVFIVIRRTSFRIPRKWWPAILAIGVLDTVAFLALLFGARAEGAPLAAVAMASYTVITVVLARIFFKENVPVRQWLGIAVVVGGVAALAYFS